MARSFTAFANITSQTAGAEIIVDNEVPARNGRAETSVQVNPGGGTVNLEGRLAAGQPWAVLEIITVNKIVRVGAVQALRLNCTTYSGTVSGGILS